MKHILVIAFSIMLGLAGTSIYAQNETPPPPPPNGLGSPQGARGMRMNFEERQQQELKWMKDSLDITEAQSEKIIELNKKRQEEFQKMREQFRQGGERPDRETMRKQRDESRAKQTASMKEILNDEQYTKYIKIQKERRERMQKARNSRNPVQKEGQRQRGRSAGE